MSAWAPWLERWLVFGIQNFYTARQGQMHLFTDSSAGVSGHISRITKQKIHNLIQKRNSGFFREAANTSFAVSRKWHGFRSFQFRIKNAKARANNIFLGTKLPIIQAPMAGVQDSALAIAVSNWGGLGSLPCAMLSLEKLRAELIKLLADEL